MAFKKGQSGNPSGRPKGSRNLRRLVDENSEKEARKQLQMALESGESWAVLAVMDRIQPKLKAITPDDSLDGEMIRARIFELIELEQRLKVLENESKGDK